MEISLKYYCILYCVITFHYLEAKPFSLNQAIAENLKRKHFETLSGISTDNSEEKIDSANPLSTSSAAKKLKDLSSLLNKAKLKLPVLKYNKKLQFKKPTKLQVKPKLYQKQVIKREGDEDYGINRKYLPLLRSISMLFDDILSPEYKSGESASFNPNSKFECKCRRKSTDLQSSESKPEKKTIITPEIISTEVPSPLETITTTERVYHITPSNIRSVRKNKVLPALFSRNTTSNRGNNNGIRKRGGPARFRNLERNISRHRGVSQHDTTKRKQQTYSDNNQENSISNSRDNASNKLGRGIRRNSTRRGSTTTTEIAELTKSQSVEITGGPLYELERENSVEVGGDQTESPVYAGGNETKSPIYVPGSSRRLRGHTTKIKESDIKKPLSSEEYNEKGFNNVTIDNASAERKPFRLSVSAEKDKIISSTNEPARLTKDSLSNIVTSSPRNKSAIVMIIDGYSVARDKNGKSRLSKQQVNYDI